MSSNVTDLPFSLQDPHLSEEVKKKIVWDPKVGFTIPYGPYTMHKLLTCHTTVNGRLIESSYFVKRYSEFVVFFLVTLFYWQIFKIVITFHYIFPNFTAPELNNVKITPENRVRILAGDTLILNCSGETTYNARINFSWNVPKKAVSSWFIIDFTIMWTSPCE